MPALKEIVADTVGASLLTASPMWEQPVDKLIPAQFSAFIHRNTQAGLRDAAESALSIALNRITAAVEAGEMPRPAILSYCLPEPTPISRDEIKSGLRFLGELRASMVLFALEVALNQDEISHLTYGKLKTLRQERPAFSELAEACLAAAPPRQLALQYVFWEDNDFGMPAPVTGLDADIFDAFGVVWAELEYAYERM